jgi:signal transduction histidine kinase
LTLQALEPVEATGFARPAWPEDERVSLARELHDVVSHAIAAIHLQAGVGLHVLADAPEQAADSLEAIKGTSKDALQELRVLLARLTGEHMPEFGEPVEPPLTSRLERLAATATAAGIPTRFQAFGPPRPVSVSAAQTLYRVVQESLTNVLRHSGATSAEISVSFEHTGVFVEIADDGVGDPDRPSPGSGLGIAGMRARVGGLGGCLEASRRQPRGFGVCAWLPDPGRT